MVNKVKVSGGKMTKKWIYVLLILFLFAGWKNKNFFSIYKKIPETTAVKTPLVISHRGEGTIHPDSTLEAFQTVADLGADYFELDIHVTKDHELVVLHDKTIDRTTTGNGTVNNMTLKQLKQYKVTNSDDEATASEIPTLEEVFQTVDTKIKYYIELKQFLENNFGKKVDIVYKNAMNPLIKMEIQNSIIYV